MEPVFLARLSCVLVIANCLNASQAVGIDLAVRGASCLVCQRRCRLEDNSEDMVSRLRCLNVLGRTHFCTDSCVSGRSAFASSALPGPRGLRAVLRRGTLP